MTEIAAQATTLKTIYHSSNWAQLVNLGWITMHTEDEHGLRIATMLATDKCRWQPTPDTPRRGTFPYEPIVI